MRTLPEMGNRDSLSSPTSNLQFGTPLRSSYAIFAIFTIASPASRRHLR